MTKPLKLAIIAGEESGDLLGEDLVRAVADRIPVQDIELIGVGGQNLQRLGLRSCSTLLKIALMGITAILAKLRVSYQPDQ